MTDLNSPFMQHNTKNFYGYESDQYDVRMRNHMEVVQAAEKNKRRNLSSYLLKKTTGITKDDPEWAKLKKLTTSGGFESFTDKYFTNNMCYGKDVIMKL